MATAWNGRIQNPIDQEGKPFKIAWDNQIIEFDMVAIPKGAPHLDLAYQYLAFISQPENNGRLGQFIPYGPVVKAATQFVPAATLAKLPTAPDHMKGVLTIDRDFWGDHAEDLNKRFNVWVAK
jgi:putative spermidine/putrescine transport system substrate-binding protein